MKRVVFIIILLFLLTTVYASNMTEDPITGKIVTGEATTQQFSMNIYIQLILPYLLITSPKNETYLKNTSLLLNYTAQNYDFLWYNLDGSSNTTINSSVYFDSSQGTHTINLYANNTNGEKRYSQVFTINPSRFLVYYDEFKGIGSTTEFEEYTYEGLQSITNITLENNYGKIRINQAVNLTNDSSNQDDSIDLDDNIEISQDNFEIDLSKLPNLNKSSTIWFYNLNYTNPRILKKGVVCPLIVCQIESFSGTTLRFSVSSLADYSVEETPEGEPGEIIIISGGGGGGGITPPKPILFTVSKEKLVVSLKQGETKEEKLIIKNTGNQKTSFSMSIEEVKELVKLSENFFELAPGEEKEISLDIIGKQGIFPNLYLGRLIVNGGGIEKEILLAIEIESKKALFDIKTTIPKKFQEISKGDELIAEVELYNLGEIREVDVAIEYHIKDSKGNEIFFEHETLAIETRANFLKKFFLSENLNYGDYVLYTQVIYNGEVASASSWFSIKEKKSNFWRIVLIIICSIIGSIILYFTFKGLRKEYIEEKQRRKNIRMNKRVMKMLGQKIKKKKETEIKPEIKRYYVIKDQVPIKKVIKDEKGIEYYY
jgi:hypothetical protein